MASTADTTSTTSSASASAEYPIMDYATQIFNNEYIFAIIAILAFAYGQRAAPKLPKWLLNLFSKDIVRVLFLSLLLVLRFESRPTIAVIIALTFVFILQYIYVEEAKDAFAVVVDENMNRQKRHKKRNRHNMLTGHNEKIESGCPCSQ